MAPQPRRKKPAKRTYRRKGRKGYRRRNYVVSRSVVPDTFLTRFVYVTTVNLDPDSTGTATYASYRANGMWDPTVAVGGHQPLGFDEYVGKLYNAFTVLGSKITCHFSPTGTNAVCNVGIQLTDGTTPNTTALTWMEQPRVRYRIAGAANSLPTATLSYKFSARKFFSKSNVTDDPELDGSASHDPTEQAYYHILGSSPGNTVDPPVIICNVRIEYIALLKKPKTLTQS